MLAWLEARSAGAAFVMRMEDLDVGRVREEYLRSQLVDLRWMGLDWDEGPDVGGEFGPYLQSLRRERYERAIEALRERGLVYECFCSRKEIAAAASAPHRAEDEGPLYPGTCRELPPAEVARRRRGRKAAMRFRVPDATIQFEDVLQGPQRVPVAEELGDFVIRRRDGVPAYQLAVVVDDVAMAITQVVRGADLLSSTARQLLLYEALGAPPPEWIHVPLLLGADGERLSKRYGAVSLTELREMDIAPEALVGWLAASCGLAEVGEEVRPADLVERFSTDRLPREASVSPAYPWE